MSKKKTHEEFCKEVYDLVGDEYEVLGGYINTATKILIRHNICGHEWDIVPNNFLSGQRCPKCRHRSWRKTTDEFKQEVFNLVGNEYEVLNEYIDNKTKLLFKHKNCNNTFLMKPNKFLTGCRCPHCKNKIIGDKLRKSHDNFCQQVSNKTNGEVVVLSQYYKSNKKVILKHNVDDCGHIWETTPNSYLNINIQNCPRCSKIEMAKNLAFSIEYVKNYISNIDNGEYSLISDDYINCKLPILVKHTKCNNIYKTTFWDIRDGHRCPICRESKGENKIRLILLENNLFFDSQFSFVNLVSDLGNKLRFDFAVFNNEEKTRLKCLIEYDGIFHYEKQYDNDGFEKIQYHDKLKNEYCKKHNIKLIRIPYWEFDNIQNILSKEIY